ncbi:putative two-component system sensor kinase [Pseudomonas sp. M47T1]|uniref:KinB sensor domain-containing domain n=1 Tax=unclassified Pseudomonas TaxID=196821 RepID=UPI000260675A|nr:KinB sensor domain-containing domain [Pseudomonas sp. M47T1]EIK97594.1 putative two-component system sensor kinase [Pseudomonas sp. M47T1]
MRLPMKLRTRLFLSFSALITVALLGLALGLVSVMQLAKTQEGLIESNFATLDLGLKLRQNLGDQLVIMLNEHGDKAALAGEQQQFQDLISQGLAHEQEVNDPAGFVQTASDYQKFLAAYQQSAATGTSFSDNQALSESFNVLRNGLIDAHKHALDNINAAQESTHQRAVLVSLLLGLVGLAVLVIGFFTAHSIARRFGEPIEALATAADNISQGNFDVALPQSSAAELAQLTQRFGTMAQVLRKHQETNVDELLAGQQRLQAVLDSIDDGLLMIDRQGHLEHLNPVAQRQLGWEDDRVGMGLGEALQRPEMDTQLALILRGGSLERALEDLSFEVDGETRLLAYSLTPVTHTEGHILGAVMVLHDVTEQRAFERVRSEFVLRASHELRTPVTGMHMAFGLLQERVHFAADSREADLLETVKEEMQRLMQLINDLLNFSRYQNGLQKLTRVPCAIDDLLDRARLRFDELARENQIDLIIEHPEALPHLHADQAQLDRVLDNLLDNALRHTPHSGRIRLQARRHAERVIISVEDNGEGIAYGQQGRIFEPFVQVGRKKGGAGLGLALCKEIVQLHGGRMGVYSRPGQGTQFYMTLPL